ncbi:unnamed protein product [Larinioides sclopetarius]|uniref:Uncharacterized protein n=1 Tax=Larinioides sclopetarius TaxID=280406 RepID=A0AAV1Z4L0_9ARAC
MFLSFNFRDIFYLYLRISLLQCNALFFRILFNFLIYYTIYV